MPASCSESSLTTDFAEQLDPWTCSHCVGVRRKTRPSPECIMSGNAQSRCRFVSKAQDRF